MLSSASGVNDNAASPSGIDVQTALGRLAGNEKLLKMLLGKFYDKYADSPEQVSSLVSKNDFTTLRQLAHEIKGVAANLAMTDLQNAAASLESAALSEDQSRAEQSVPGFGTTFREVHEGLKGWLGK